MIALDLAQLPRMDKESFSKELIKALREAQDQEAKTPKTAASLARSAYEKLQYDFPVSMTSPLAAGSSAPQQQRRGAQMSSAST